MLHHRQLSCLVHVIEIPDSRLPHSLLYGQLDTATGVLVDKRNASRITSSQSIRKCSISFNRLVARTSNIGIWRSTSAFVISRFDTEYDRFAALRCSRRHMHAAVLRPIPDSLHQCRYCGRRCFSRIGLLSHCNTHIQR